MVIPGKESVTEENVDVYLAPLMEELQKLWNSGVDCYDVLQRPNLPQRFTLRAMVLWTIHDYPGYGLISGQQHSGYKGCVICGPHCVARGSQHLNKREYGGSRRWLPSKHPFRSKECAKYFDGQPESRPAPPRMSSKDRQCWGKAARQYFSRTGTKATDDACPTKIHGVKRETALYQLPYWNVSCIPMILAHMFASVFYSFLVGSKECRQWLSRSLRDLCLLIIVCWHAETTHQSLPRWNAL